MWPIFLDAAAAAPPMAPVAILREDVLDELVASDTGVVWVLRDGLALRFDPAGDAVTLALPPQVSRGSFTARGGELWFFVDRTLWHASRDKVESVSTSPNRPQTTWVGYDGDVWYLTSHGVVYRRHGEVWSSPVDELVDTRLVGSRDGPLLVEQRSTVVWRWDGGRFVHDTHVPVGFDLLDAEGPSWVGVLNGQLVTLAADGAVTVVGLPMPHTTYDEETPILWVGDHLVVGDRGRIRSAFDAYVVDPGRLSRGRVIAAAHGVVVFEDGTVWSAGGGRRVPLAPSAMDAAVVADDGTVVVLVREDDDEHLLELHDGAWVPAKLPEEPPREPLTGELWRDGRRVAYRPRGAGVAYVRDREGRWQRDSRMAAVRWWNTDECATFEALRADHPELAGAKTCGPGLPSGGDRAGYAWALGRLVATGDRLWAWTGSAWDVVLDTPVEGVGGAGEAKVLQLRGHVAQIGGGPTSMVAAAPPLTPEPWPALRTTTPPPTVAGVQTPFLVFEDLDAGQGAWVQVGADAAVRSVERGDPLDARDPELRATFLVHRRDGHADAWLYGQGQDHLVPTYTTSDRVGLWRPGVDGCGPIGLWTVGDPAPVWFDRTPPLRVAAADDSGHVVAETCDAAAEGLVLDGRGVVVCRAVPLEAVVQGPDGLLTSDGTNIWRLTGPQCRRERIGPGSSPWQTAGGACWTDDQGHVVCLTENGRTRSPQPRAASGGGLGHGYTASDGHVVQVYGYDHQPRGTLRFDDQVVQTWLTETHVCARVAAGALWCARL